MYEESEEWYSNPHPCKKEEDMFSDDSNDRHKGVLA